MPEWTTTVRYSQSASFYPTCLSQTYANHTVWSNQLDQVVGLATRAIALRIRLEVSEVTDVTGLILGRTVGLAVWVD